MPSRPTLNPRRAAPTLSLLCAALLGLAAPMPASALHYVWNGSNGAWEDTTRWSLLGLPGAGDSAELLAGVATLSTAQSVGELWLSGGQITGTGALTIGTLHFDKGNLGGPNSNPPTGSTTVTGSTSFLGTSYQGVARNHTLTLQGPSTWTVGPGNIAGSGAAAAGGTIISSAGATFTDLGTASAATYRELMSSSLGGSFVNDGTYVRSGLGTTRASGFVNNGLLQVDAGLMQMRGNGSSSGRIEVAAGAVLGVYAPGATFTLSGVVANQGLFNAEWGTVVLDATSQLNGRVQVLDAEVYNQGAQSLQSLTMNGVGRLSGSGSVQVVTLQFDKGALGGTGGGIPPVGHTTVTGTAAFLGTGYQGVAAQHTLTLQGTSNWSVGNGGIASGGAAAAGGTIINAAGATFTDLGAASVATYRELMSSSLGGSFVNDGTYVRSGLGTTRASGFVNHGELRIEGGTVAVDAGFSNTGSVRLGTETVLLARAAGFANDGLVTGTGTLRPLSYANANALVNRGTLDPGSAGAAGTLTVDGDLSMAEASVLRIDLFAGSNDLLVVNDSVLWNGELALWAGEATAARLLAGESITLATFASRLNASTFDSISFHGLDGSGYSLEYAANSLVLHAAAVPEPAAWALMALGVGALLARRRMQLR